MCRNLSLNKLLNKVIKDNKNWHLGFSTRTQSKKVEMKKSAASVAFLILNIEVYSILENLSKIWRWW